MEETFKYEKSIGLKTIWLTFVRRWKSILLILIPLAAISFAAVKILIKPTYSSTVSITKNAAAALSAADHNNIVACYNDNEVIAATVELLATDEYKITVDASFIKSGLSAATFATNEAAVKITFTSKAKTDTQKILNALSVKAIEKIKTGTYSLPNAKAGEASATKESSNAKKYLLIALAASVVVALAIPFIDEIISDEVYDKKDIEFLGCEGFEIDVSKLTVNKNE
ncbi:MAG: hypothetical protein J6M95_02090 [Bacilli bacterium]|nr:hypothetical protein [Bacilli bacterium]